MSDTITGDEATHSDIYTDPNLFLWVFKVEGYFLQTWTNFEKDLEEFELKTSTANRLDKTDSVKTANKKQHLG